MTVLAWLPDVVAFLARNGGTLAVGATVVLLGGCLAAGSGRNPERSRRIGAWTAVGVLVYLGLALAPLPRWVPSWSPVAGSGKEAWRSQVAPSEGPLHAPVLRSPGDGPAAASVPSAPVSAGSADVLLSGPPTGFARSEAPSPCAGRALAWPEALASLWLLGAALAAGWLGLGCFQLARLLRLGRPGPDALTRTAGQSGLRVRVVPRQVTPFCCGWLRPVIVLPASLLLPERRAAALAALRHEAAHVRAGDLQVQALFALLLPGLFWHPLFWLLRGRVRRSAELLADADAAAAIGVPGYARGLVALAEDRAGIAAAPALSVFRSPSELCRRIEMLLHDDRTLTLPVSSSRRTLQALGTAAMVACAGLLFGVAPARSQEPRPAPGPVGAQQEPQQAPQPGPEPLLRAENDRLRAEIETLRAQIAELQAHAATDKNPLARIARLRAQAAAEPPADNGAAALAHELRWRELADEMKEAVGARSGNDADIERVARAITQCMQRRQPDNDPTAAAGAADPSVSGRTYVVQKGDSLEDIAGRVYGSDRAVADLQAANPDVDPRRLRVGQVLALPDLPVGGAGADGATRRAQDRQGDPTALLDLARRVYSLRGEVELSMTEADRLRRLAEKGLADTNGARAAEIRRETAQRTLEFALRLVESEIETARSEQTALKETQGAADPAAAAANPQEIERRIQALERRIELLRRIR